MRKHIKYLLFAIILAFNPIYGYGQYQTDTVKVLFIGNSYTYTENLPQVITFLSEFTNTRIVTQKSTVGGATLKQHWYGERGLKSVKLIRKGNFDLIVLQEHSMGAINHPDTTLKYINLFSQLIKEKNAQLLLYETWAREKTPECQQQISRFYQDAAKLFKGKLVPVGQAWTLAKKMRPSIDLFTNDGSHPDKLGTFLSACVFTSFITNQRPEVIANIISTKDISGQSLVLMHIDKLDAQFCYHISEEILKTK